MATVPLGKGRYQNRNQKSDWNKQLNGAANQNLAQWETEIAITRTIPKMNQLNSQFLFVWLKEPRPQMSIIIIVFFLLLINALVIVKPIANIAKFAGKSINSLCNCLFQLNKQLQCTRAMDSELNLMTAPELQGCKTRQARTSINPKTGKNDDDTIDDDNHNDNNNWFEPIVTWPRVIGPQTQASAPIAIDERAREQSFLLHTSHKQQWLNATRATNKQMLLFEKEKEETNEMIAKLAAKQDDNNRKRSRQLIDDESMFAALTQLKEKLTDEVREEEQDKMELAKAINLFQKERKKAGEWNESYVLAKTFANDENGNTAKQQLIERANQSITKLTNKSGTSATNF